MPEISFDERDGRTKVYSSTQCLEYLDIPCSCTSVVAVVDQVGSLGCRRFRDGRNDTVDVKLEYPAVGVGRRVIG